jgi:superfamily II DNA or RNA helicase
MSTRKPLPKLRYSEKFRHYQQEAIKEARKYRADFSEVVAKTPAYGAFLVCHPTATGKTAVIAGLSQACPEIGNVLILTTREAVRDQLVRELSGNIFIEPEKFGLGQNIRLTKNTYVVDESRKLDGQTDNLYRTTLKLLNTDELRDFYKKQFERIVTAPDDDFLIELAENRSIVVMTVQMLIGLDPLGDVYTTLRDHIELVLFDEGHYEPAAKYSAGVRGLRKPVVLLSATPFRNDLKPFHIDASNIHI